MPLLKEKTSRIGSLIGFLVVTALIVSFSLALPEFLLSTTGRIFAVLWALVAIAVFLAHSRRISLRRQPVRMMSPAGITKRAASQKKRNMMRG
jgi:apolipoprotein N-acyltransferase